MIFGINHPLDFWKFWNCPRFIRAISRFSKMHLGNLSQIALPNMLLLLLTFIECCDYTSMTWMQNVYYVKIHLWSTYPVDTGRKLNVHKTFRRRPGRVLNVICTFNLRPVSTGISTKCLQNVWEKCNPREDRLICNL